MQFSSLLYQLRDPPISFSVTWTLYLHYLVRGWILHTFLSRVPNLLSLPLFKPKYSPEHPVLKHSKCVLVPSKGERLCIHKIQVKFVLTIWIFTHLDSTLEDKKSLTVQQKPFPKFGFKMGCMKVNCPVCRQKKNSIPPVDLGGTPWTFRCAWRHAEHPLFQMWAELLIALCYGHSHCCSSEHTAAGRTFRKLTQKSYRVQSYIRR